MMEYQLVDGIYKLSEHEKPMIAYSFGNGEPQDARVYDLVENLLKNDYNLEDGKPHHPVIDRHF